MRGIHPGAWNNISIQIATTRHTCDMNVHAAVRLCNHV